MAKDLSLKIAIKLLTNNFNKGIAGVTSMIRSMTMRIMAYASALGVGAISASNFISKLRDVAKETTQANIALKNVSGGIENFSANQAWLIELSKKYGVNINALTLSYAKFKAAADIANMSIADQRKIFDSVARSAVAFGLNAEDQRGVFMALQQMMSKGKVMAEELRLQLAERMPVATQAMARAVGVSVEELDKLLKQGKVLSKDVLPRFADELAKVTQNVDTDNLNKSLVDFGNVFVDLAKKLNFEGLFKGLVEKGTAALRLLADNANIIAGVIKAALYGMVGYGVRGIFSGFVGESEKAIASAIKKEEQLTAAKAKEAEAREALTKAEAANEEALNLKKSLGADATAKAQIAAARRVEQTEARLEKARRDHNQRTENLKRAEAAVTADVQEQAALKTASTWRKAMNGVSIAAGRAWKSIKAFGITSIWTALLGLLASIVKKLWDIAANAIRIRRIVKDTIKELNKPVATPADVNEVKVQFDIVQNKSGKYNDAQREAALKRLNELLGTEYKLTAKLSDKYDEITRKITRFNEYLMAQQKLEQARQALADKEEAKADKLGEEGFKPKRTIRVNRETGKTIAIEENEDFLELKNYNAAIAEAKKAVEQRTAEVAKYAAEFSSESRKSPLDLGGGGDADTPKDRTPSQEFASGYIDQLDELATQRRLNLISEKEYDRALRDLIEKTYAEANAKGDVETLNSPIYRNIEAQFVGSTHGELREREEAIVDAIDEYEKKLLEQQRLFDQKAVTEEQYREALQQLAKKVYEELAGFDLTGISRDVALRATTTKSAAAITTRANSRVEPSSSRRRISPVDLVKMTEAERIEVQLTLAQDELANLRSEAENVVGGMLDEIAEKEKKVKSLSEALALAETEEALKRVNKELIRGSWDTLSGAVHGVDGLVGAIDTLKSTLSDEDASGWEKFVAGFAVLENVVNTAFTIADGIKAMKDALLAATAAKQSIAATEKVQAAQTVAQNTAVAASEAGKSASKTIPFPFSLAAIGVAIAAVIAAFGALPKFAKGGVVGGNSKHGDKVLARLNSGEGVLTEQGMTNLDALAAASTRPPVNVHITGEFTASGRALKLVLDRQTRHEQRTK